MDIDSHGIVCLSEKELLKALYSDTLSNLNNIITTKEVADKFNLAKNINRDDFNNIRYYQPIAISVEEFDRQNQTAWFMPEDYCPNLIEYLYSRCQTEQETERVNLELELFIKHNMLDLLFYLKYLVDTMRQHKIVWGVGRGSSVASYVLYLIGVHRINSIKYNLDIHEFLK